MKVVLMWSFSSLLVISLTFDLMSQGWWHAPYPCGVSSACVFDVILILPDYEVRHHIKFFKRFKEESYDVHVCVPTLEINEGRSFCCSSGNHASYSTHLQHEKQAHKDWQSDKKKEEERQTGWRTEIERERERGRGKERGVTGGTAKKWNNDEVKQQLGWVTEA